MWIVGFDTFDALDGIATTEREERVTAPFGPDFEAAERTAAFKLRRVLATKTPDRQDSREQLSSVLLNVPEEPGREVSLLGILASRVELTDQEAPHQVLGEGNAVAGDGDEGRAVERDHLGPSQQAHHRRPLGQHGRQKIGAEHGTVQVIRKQKRCCLDQDPTQPAYRAPGGRRPW